MTAFEFGVYRADVGARAVERLGKVVEHVPGFEVVSALGERVQGVMDAAADFADTAMNVVGQAWEATKSGVGAAVDWVKNNWQGIAMVAAGVALTLALGPVAGGILGGALISGGISAVTNKNADGSINWRAVGKDMLFGAVTGGVGGLAVKGVAFAASAVNSSRGGVAFLGSLSKAKEAAAFTDEALAATAQGSRRFYSSQASQAWAKSDELLAASARYTDRAQYFAGRGPYAGGGFVRATGTGAMTGVGSTVLPTFVPGDSAVSRVSEYTLGRSADFFSGGINDMVTTANEDESEDFSNKGIQEVFKGGASNPGDFVDMVKPK